MLRENAALLEPHVRVFLKEAFEPLTDCARAFSIDPKKRTLSQIAKTAAAFFDALSDTDPRPIVMSSEDLSGHMPGRHGLECYDSTGLVMKCLTDVALRRFGPTTDLTFYFSTRGHDAWLRSTWWQNLRSTRLTDDLQAYSAQFDAARSLDDILEEIALDVSPARVTSFLLEDTADLPLGPLDPLLALLELTELDRTQLAILPPENVQPDMGIHDVFLALNRSALSEKDIQEAKRLVRRMAQQPDP